MSKITNFEENEIEVTDEVIDITFGKEAARIKEALGKPDRESYAAVVEVDHVLKRITIKPGKQ